MPYLDENAVKLVDEVKAAIARAEGDLQSNGLKVKSVKLDLETELEAGGGGGFEFLKLVGLDADVSRDQTQTISIAFEPPAAKTDEGILPSMGDELQNAIVVIAAATKEATADKSLKLTDAEVGLQVGVTEDGSVKVFAKASVKHANTHTLTIGLAPS